MEKTPISAQKSNVKFSIIIPFRDNAEQKRTAHLETIIPHLESILSHIHESFEIVIVEQSTDDKKFNRGKLLNVGFEYAVKRASKYVILHDVDMLPDHELIQFYVTFPTNPIHIADINPKYPFPNYFGGIQSFSVPHYRKINGYPNNFWGWGGEDDEILKRVRDCKIKISKPNKGKFMEIEHGWNPSEGIPKVEKKQLLRSHQSTWRKNGLNNMKYLILNEDKLSDFTVKITVLL